MVVSSVSSKYLDYKFETEVIDGRPSEWVGLRVTRVDILPDYYGGRIPITLLVYSGVSTCTNH